MLLLDLELARRLYRDNGAITNWLDDIGVAIAAVNQSMESEISFTDFKIQIFKDSYEDRKQSIEEVLNKQELVTAEQFGQVTCKNCTLPI